MKFSDTTNKTGIVQDIERMLNLTDGAISGDATKLKEWTARINNNLDIIVGYILGADNRWQWDDTNHSTEPIGTAHLVSSQASYRFDSTWLRVTRIEAKDSADNWVLLKPIDPQDVRNEAMGEYKDVAGIPDSYDVNGDLVTLYPAPNYASTGGLKVYFQREPDYFTTADTTQEPGFPSPYHRLLVYGPARDYAIEKQIGNKVTVFSQLYEQLILQLKDNLAERNAMEKPRIIGRYRNPR